MQALDRATEWLCDGERIGDTPLPQRRADALAALAERFLTKSPDADEGLRSADRYQVVIHASAEALPEYGPVDPEDPPQVQDGPVLATETVRRITCDCSVVPIWETKDGEPLRIGRKARVVTPALNRALKRRDGGCRFPGCVNTRFVQGHHIQHWADGGETSLENTVLLCSHHHRLVHEGGYYIVTDGCEFLFFRGDGFRIQSPGPGRIGEPSVKRDNRKRVRSCAGGRPDTMSAITRPAPGPMPKPWPLNPVAMNSPG